MDAKEVQILADALRTMPFEEASSLMADIVKAFFKNNNVTSLEKRDMLHVLGAMLEDRMFESIMQPFQSAKKSYLLEYLANNDPASQLISVNMALSLTTAATANTERITTTDDDDYGASIELFEFPTKVCAVVIAGKGRKAAKAFNKSKSGNGKARAKLKPNPKRLTRKGIADMEGAKNGTQGRV